MFRAKVLLSSINSATGDMLTTFEIEHPRIIHAEFMTHRVFSRNAASSRAIPVAKTIEKVMTDPFIPMHWGAAEKGMQAFSECTNLVNLKEVYNIPSFFNDNMTSVSNERAWLLARDTMVKIAEAYLNAGYHKQVVNRLLEPWSWITVIVSSTTWNNFFRLRTHKAAEPHMQHLATLMRAAHWNRNTQLLDPGDWHLPLFGYLGDTEIEQVGNVDITIRQTEVEVKEKVVLPKKVLVSTGRCARVSYLTHDGLRDPQKDVDLAMDLLHYDKPNDPQHWSPWEHPAMALEESKMVGNFKGFLQARKFFPDESGD